MIAEPAELTIEDWRAKVGEEIGVSPWMMVDQKRIDGFADLVEDHQFIHVDPEAAKNTPFGGTIAHGFLTLSLLSQMAYSTLPPIAGTAMGINYGFDRIRFLAPVPAGSRVRGRFKLTELTARSANQYLSRHEVTVEIEGRDKPALIADWLGMTVLA